MTIKERDIVVRLGPASVPKKHGDVHLDESRIRQGGLSFGTGVAGDMAGVFDAQYIRVTTPVLVNTEFKVQHTLGRIPQMMLVVRKPAACDVYDSVTTWTDSAIYLKATVGSLVLKLLVA